jgi:hypothetical protein
MAHVKKITPEELEQENPYLQGKGKLLAVPLAIAGLVLIGVGWLTIQGQPDNTRHFLFSYLTGFAYVASLSLGAMFFTLLQHATRAAWSVVVRRIAEVMASNIVWVFVLGLVVLLPEIRGDNSIYFWLADQYQHQHIDPGVTHKLPWLNQWGFVLRMVGYFAFWTWLTWNLLSNSRKQDKTGDAKLTLWMWRLSAPSLLAFALTLTFFMVDLIMSLDPEFFSTMIGVYYFAGCAVSAFSLLTLLCLLLQGSGRLKRAITLEHYHDLGKLMFAFTFFWGYIAFSQFMLIWYGNIPEEMHWFARRELGGVPGTFGFLHGWMGLGYLLLFGQMLIPFAGLLSRWVKRNRLLLGVWTVWILVLHYFDMYWLIMPEYVRNAAQLTDKGTVPLAPVDFLCWIGLLLLWLAGVAWRADQQALVPLRDPLLADSLAFDNVKV